MTDVLLLILTVGFFVAGYFGILRLCDYLDLIKAGRRKAFFTEQEEVAKPKKLWYTE